MLSLLFALTVGAVQPTTDPPCRAAEHHQFDFWIGEWDVDGPDGRRLGTNRITAILSGCALQEEWTSADGRVRGTSQNAFDVEGRRWHQAWVDTAGQRLDLVGGLVGTAMVLEQKGPGGHVERVTWTPLPDGRVRQHWEASDDGGTSWKTSFDGYYRRRVKTP